jgi:hypothetical protein
MSTPTPAAETAPAEEPKANDDTLWIDLVDVVRDLRKLPRAEGTKLYTAAYELQIDGQPVKVAIALGEDLAHVSRVVGSIPKDAIA